MIVKNNKDIEESIPEEKGIRNVTRKILIGSQDGSENIIMRLFKLLPGGHTPYHDHRFEHVVKIEKGKGVIITESGEEIEVSEGQSAFIPSHEKHQFKNPYQEPFEFICVIQNQDKIS